MDIRKPDQWEVGDRAYCVEDGLSFSAGDILRVSVVDGDLLRFGSATLHSRKRFARILTHKEVHYLKKHVQEAELYAVYSPARTSKWNDCCNPEVYKASDVTGTKSHIYALKSLPEPQFKVGDWVMYLVHCEPPLHNAAMQRIEAAEKELAEAKKMLHGN